MEGETNEITIEIKHLSGEDIRRIFANFNAVVSGHFVLKNRGIQDELNEKKIPGCGDHSATYVNKDMLYVTPDAFWLLCADIALRFSNTPPVHVVAGLVAGTVCPAWLVKQFLFWITGTSVESVYIEEKNGEKIIKRGFDWVVSGKNILFVEDITTTGKSLQEGINTVREVGGNVIGAAVMCNRSGGKVTAESLGIPRLYNQLELSSAELKKYPLEECPLCERGIPVNRFIGHGAEFLKNRDNILSLLK